MNQRKGVGVIFALALALGLAACGEHRPALEAAYALHAESRLQGPLTELGGKTIHVFEDAASGLAAAERAVEALKEAGLAVEFRAYGISPGEGPKHRALQAQGIPAYPSINDALATALDAIPSPDDPAPG